MRITSVTCENMKHPISITSAHPTFSWKIEADKPNVFQTKWQIIVTEDSGDVVWDSKVQEGTDTIAVLYAGAGLKSCTGYSYQIISWNNLGEQAVSEGNRFETAFFHHSEWKAHWIEPEPLPQLPENPLIQAQKEWTETVNAMMRGEPVEMRMDGRGESEKEQREGCSCQICYSGNA